jgi:hypothetical protein
LIVIWQLAAAEKSARSHEKPPSPKQMTPNPRIKLYSTVGAGLALSLALFSNTRAAALFESFETAVPVTDGVPYTSITQDTTTGVTNGTHSMKVVLDNTMTWEWIGITNAGTSYADFKAHKRLLFDIHRTPRAEGANLEVVIALNGDGATWTQTQLLNWQWFNANQNYTTTLEVDYTAMRDAAPATGAWFQVNLMFRSGAGAEVYIDNIRFEGDPPPPPASDAYTFNTATQGFGPTTGAVPVTWSSSFGGSLAMPGNSAGWKEHASKGFGTTTAFAPRLAESATRGGTLLYDMIAPAGTLSNFFVQTVLQHSSGTWNQFDQNLAPASVVPLPGGMELVRVVIPTSVYPNLVATGSYTMRLNWDSATANTIHLDNVMIIPNGSDSAKLTFDESEQGFAAEGANSSVAWTGSGVQVDGPSGWDWGTKANFTAANPDPQVAAVFSKLALAATKGGALRFKVIEPYVNNPTAAFLGMGVNVGLSGSPWQQQYPTWLPKANFTEGGDPLADPPVIAGQTPTGFTRTANVTLYPGTATQTNGLKLASAAAAYELWLGTDVSNVDGSSFTFDDFEVIVNRDPQILHTPPVPNNTASPMVGRVLSNGEGFTTYSATGLPPGVTIDPVTGLVAGTPTANGTYSVVFTVTTGTATSSAAPVEWVVSGVTVDPTPVIPVISSFTYDGTQAVISWSGTGATPVNVLRSQTLELGSWTNISPGDTDGTHTDATPPAGKAFYRVEVP